MFLKRVSPATGAAAALAVVGALALAACGKPAATPAPGAAAPATAPAATPPPTVATPVPAPAAAAPATVAPAVVAPERGGWRGKGGRGGRGGGQGGGGQGGGGRGGGGRRAMLNACAADIAKFCPGNDKPGKCLKPHKAELSAGCQAARAQLKAAREARMGRNTGQATAAGGTGDDE